MHPASKQGLIRGVVYAFIITTALRFIDLDKLSWLESILIAIVGGVVIALLLEPILRKIYPYRRDPSDR